MNADRGPADFGLGCPFWGMIDIEQYEHDDNPLNGDLAEVLPGKLIAFRR